MKIIVLGSGVIGTTSAYYLARAGHEVTVFDRQGAPGLETSYANAGQISPGYAAPWAAPGVPLKAIGWALQRHAPLAIGFDGTLDQLRWIWRLLRNCNPADYATNKARMVRLAAYSRACLHQLIVETGISYEGRRGGTLQVFRTQAQLDAIAKDVAVLQEAGVPFQVLTREQLEMAEPALAATKTRLTGGLRLPNDETGDCQLFTSRLAELATELGVQFRFGAQVERLQSGGDRIDSVLVDGELHRADAYVVALGSFTTKFLNGLISVPVYPLKGYSITVPIEHRELAPVSTVLDETYKIAITRFDDRIRVGGMAEVRGFDLELRQKRRQTLEMCLGDLFPGAGNTAVGTFWTGLRPMTPDGTPIVGSTPVPNLYLNTGHGTLGWTMACGSGKLLADIVSRVTPEIRADDLSVERYEALGRRSAAGTGARDEQAAFVK